MAAEASTGPSAGTGPLPPVAGRYLLIINVPLYRTADGRIHADQLWHRDLVRHLDYIDDLTLACPVITGTPPDHAVALEDDPRQPRIRLVALPPAGSLAEALLRLPSTLWRLYRAISNADIVHSGIAGWPIPYGWIATPLARLLGKPVVIIVESAPWRPQPGIAAGFKSRFVAGVFEFLGRWCVENAQLAIFTQEGYRTSLLRRHPQTGHVVHASWIDEGLIIREQDAQEDWREKTGDPSRPLRLLFAGRLEPEKGILVLLAAMQSIARHHGSVELDILGTGSLAGQCAAAGAALRGAARINLLGTVPYGPALFQLMRQYHALVVPSISDEQPRIVYDAYSQALPVLATRTAGLRDCVIEGRTGWLAGSNDAEQLADMIGRALRNPAELRAMGINALHAAQGMTHRQMHEERHRLLLRMTGYHGSDATT